MRILRLLLWLIPFVAACDKVELPIAKPEPVPIDTTTQFPTIDTAALNTATRKVLVEEFTGNQCTGCPTQTRKLLTLQANNHPNVIVLAYHAGDFADVNAEYPTEFKTDHGNEIHQMALDAGLTGYPTAYVNREVFNLSQVFLGHDAWKVPINDQLDDTASFGLGVAATLNEGKAAIRVSVKLPSSNIPNTRLVLLCTEDSVISKQLDNGVVIDDYAHRHVVRGSVNAETNALGESILSAGTLPDTEWLDFTYAYSLPASVVNTSRVYFVAYLLNDDTGTVLQSEETHAAE